MMIGYDTCGIYKGNCESQSVLFFSSFCILQNILPHKPLANDVCLPSSNVPFGHLSTGVDSAKTSPQKKHTLPHPSPTPLLPPSPAPRRPLQARPSPPSLSSASRSRLLDLLPEALHLEGHSTQGTDAPGVAHRLGSPGCCDQASDGGAQTAAISVSNWKLN